MSKSLTAGMQEIELSMTNFDGTVDDGFEDALRKQPGKCFGPYAGWNFYAHVWFVDDLFHAEVWCYGSPVKTVAESTLEGIIQTVSNEFGWD